MAWWTWLCLPIPTHAPRNRYMPFWEHFVQTQSVPNGSSIAAPLSDLIRKGQLHQVPWTTSTEQAFQQLKETLTCAPVLQRPDISLLFIIHTNTSDRELGTVLSQAIKGEEHPVLYLIDQLSPDEILYALVEWEALIIKWTIEELRYF